MVTRLYLPSSCPTGWPSSPVPAASNTWLGTPTVTLRAPLTRQESGTAKTDLVSPAETSTSVSDVFSGAQFISAPLRAQTISGTFTLVERVLESNAAADMSLQCKIRVISAGGTELAVLYGGHTTALGTTWGVAGHEFGTSTSSRLLSGTLTSYTCADGDRIVVEIGARAHNTVATSYTTTHRFGDSVATDFDTAATAANDFTPWIEFSGTLAWQATRLYFPSAAYETSVIGDIGMRTPTLDHTGAGGTALTLNVPTSTADGDFLTLAVSGCGTMVNAPATPAGWSILYPWTFSGTTLAMIVFYRFASSEPGSYAFTGMDAARWAGIMRCDTNVDPSSPQDVAQQVGSSTTVQAPNTAITPISDRTRVVGWECGVANAATTTTWSTATSGAAIDAVETSSAAAATNAAMATASVGPVTPIPVSQALTMTPSGTIARGLSVTVALRPKTVPISPTPSGNWDITTGFFRLPTDTAKANTAANLFTSAAETSTSLRNILVAQYVSASLKAQDLAGLFTAMLFASESSASADMSVQVIVRVVNSSGVEQAVLFAGHSATLNASDLLPGREVGTSRSSKGLIEVPITPYTCANTDRLVVEIGLRAHNVSATSFTGSMRLGDDQTAVDAAITDGGSSTTDLPWVELSNDLLFNNVAARLSAAGFESVIGVSTPEAQVSALGLEVLMTRTVSIEHWGRSM